jgi:hypothetical protein
MRVIGAIDVIVIEQPDGTLKSTTWHIAFSAAAVVSSRKVGFVKAGRNQARKEGEGNPDKYRQKNFEKKGTLLCFVQNHR